MAQAEDNPWRIPVLGTSAAAFAAALVIANLQPFDKSAEIAARYLAAGVPGWIAIVLASRDMRRMKRFNAPEPVLWFLDCIVTLVAAAAQLSCGLGIYWLFRHISIDVGRIFLVVSLAVYLGYAVLYALPERYFKNKAMRRGSPDEATGT